MSVAVQQLLDTFDALPAAEKHQAAVEILRRYDEPSEEGLSDETLTALADELFAALDEEEAGHAPR
jgi:hypothetical protein